MAENCSIEVLTILKTLQLCLISNGLETRFLDEKLGLYASLWQETKVITLLRLSNLSHPGVRN
ncbi:MAG: hypothetical protein LH628_12635 [Microcoleus sp. CAN_BIN18]|nr:hypothetical protein [Microcoleus sp. CAN_BIN18]